MDRAIDGAARRPGCGCSGSRRRCCRCGAPAALAAAAVARCCCRPLRFGRPGARQRCTARLPPPSPAGAWTRRAPATPRPDCWILLADSIAHTAPAARQALLACAAARRQWCAFAHTHTKYKHHHPKHTSPNTRQEDFQAAAEEIRPVEGVSWDDMVRSAWGGAHAWQRGAWRKGEERQSTTGAGEAREKKRELGQSRLTAAWLPHALSLRLTQNNDDNIHHNSLRCTASTSRRSSATTQRVREPSIYACAAPPHDPNRVPPPFCLPLLPQLASRRSQPPSRPFIDLISSVLPPPPSLTNTTATPTNAAKPGLLDPKGRKKWEAWTSKKGARACPPSLLLSRPPCAPARRGLCARRVAACVVACALRRLS